MEGKIHIDGVIGTNSDEVSLVSITKQLDACNGADSIAIFIDSVGGSVSEAMNIISAIQAFNLPIKTVIKKDCASAATLIQLMGSERLASKDAVYRIHKPTYNMLVNVNADELLEYQEELQSVENQFIEAYAKISGKDLEEVRELMEEDRDLSIKEAIDLNFITDVIDNSLIKAKAENAFIKAIKTTKNKLSEMDSDLIKKLLKEVQALVGGKGKAQILAVKLKDGTEIDVSELAIGGTVKIGTELAPDGIHELEDGTKVTTKEGLIELIEKPEDAGNKLEIELEDLKRVNAELSAKCDEYKAEIDNMKNSVEAKDKEMLAYKTEVQAKITAINEAIEANSKAKTKQPDSSAMGYFEQFKGKTATQIVQERKLKTN